MRRRSDRRVLQRWSQTAFSPPAACATAHQPHTVPGTLGLRTSGDNLVRAVLRHCRVPNRSDTENFIEKLSVYLSAACRILEHRAERTGRQQVSRAKTETQGQGMSEAQRQGTHGGRTRKRKEQLVNKMLLCCDRITAVLSVLYRHHQNSGQMAITQRL